MKLTFNFIIVVSVIALMAFMPRSKGHYPGNNHTIAIGSFPDTTRIVLEKKTVEDMPVLFIHDTAATTEAMGSIFGRDYGELMRFANTHNLTPAKFLGFYYTTQPPWIMDVAIETGKLPMQTTGRIQTKILIGGEVLIAHVLGPYNTVGRAYMQIQNWLQQNGRKARENAFEVYVNDPATVANPSHIQTDIYQPLE